VFQLSDRFFRFICRHVIWGKPRNGFYSRSLINRTFDAEEAVIQPKHGIAKVSKKMMSRSRIVTELLKDDVTDSTLAQHLFHSLQRIEFKSFHVQLYDADIFTL